MIELLTDDQGQPIPVSISQSSDLWDRFVLPQASETELIFLLKSSVLNKFEDIDNRLDQLVSIKVFNKNCLEYLAAIHRSNKRFDRDLSFNLAIKKNNLVAVVSIGVVDQTLDLLCASRPQTSLLSIESAVTDIVNSLLHWLWLDMNSF
jgi:hypothetical protein